MMCTSYGIFLSTVLLYVILIHITLLIKDKHDRMPGVNCGVGCGVCSTVHMATKD